MKKKEEWAKVNGLGKNFNQPTFPIVILPDASGHDFKYHMKKYQLEEAYFHQNLAWRKTRDYILERITKLRTDKEQYQKNLLSLEKNDELLRAQVKNISGKMYPPFPDPWLYSSIFHSPHYKPGEMDKVDLTFRTLTGAIEQNNIYYHQELGKFNQLKKEECNLIDKYLQIQTRMKLWIIRERIRLVAWELMHSHAYDEEEVLIELEDTLVTEKYKPGQELKDRKRTYQCLDFCQCEIGCSSLVLTDPKEKIFRK